MSSGEHDLPAEGPRGVLSRALIVKEVLVRGAGVYAGTCELTSMARLAVATLRHIQLDPGLEPMHLAKERRLMLRDLANLAIRSMLTPPNAIPAGCAASSAGSTSPGAPAHKTTTGGAGSGPVLQSADTVDPHVLNTGRGLVRFFIGRVILDRCRVENDDIGKVTCEQSASMLERQIGGRQCREIASCKEMTFSSRTYFARRWAKLPYARGW